MEAYIINPKSGNGTGKKVGHDIEQIIKTHELNAKTYYTDDKNNASYIAQYCAYDPNVTKVNIVGGDGTVNEVINGAIGSGKPISIIPAGSGNDFYRVLSKLPLEKIDIGRVVTKEQSRYFINVLSFGEDAHIADTANVLKDKGVNGKIVYPLSIAKQICTYKPISIEVNDHKTSVTLLAICNGQYYGHNIPINPDFNLHDGLFEVYQVAPANRIRQIRLLWKISKGTHSNYKLVDRKVLKDLKVSADKPIICNIDGEIIISKEFVVENLKERLLVTSELHPKVKQLIN